MYKILAVDDEPLICKVLERYLTLKGFIVLTALCGEAALDIIEKEKPDLVILDKRMPGIGGLNVMKELKARHIDIPVILLSGSPVAEECLPDIDRLTDRDLLLKPFGDMNLLCKMILQRLHVDHP